MKLKTLQNLEKETTFKKLFFNNFYWMDKLNALGLILSYFLSFIGWIITEKNQFLIFAFLILLIIYLQLVQSIKQVLKMNIYPFLSQKKWTKKNFNEIKKVKIESILGYELKKKIIKKVKKKIIKETNKDTLKNSSLLIFPILLKIAHNFIEDLKKFCTTLNCYVDFYTLLFQIILVCLILFYVFKIIKNYYSTKKHLLNYLNNFSVNKCKSNISVFTK